MFQIRIYTLRLAAVCAKPFFVTLLSLGAFKLAVLLTVQGTQNAVSVLRFSALEAKKLSVSSCVLGVDPVQTASASGLTSTACDGVGTLKTLAHPALHSRALTRVGVTFFFRVHSNAILLRKRLSFEAWT